jgi:hypothetical protein
MPPKHQQSDDMSNNDGPTRVYEKDLDENGHLKNCGDVPQAVLTLHQPLASFMVYGLKRVEGRNWDSNFRGKLWIHGASLEPDEERIKSGEEFYKQVFAKDVDGTGEGIKLPPHYPTSALVGLVDVADVAIADEYNEWDSLPDGAKLEVCFFSISQRTITSIATGGPQWIWVLLPL